MPGKTSVLNFNLSSLGDLYAMVDVAQIKGGYVNDLKWVGKVSKKWNSISLPLSMWEQ